MARNKLVHFLLSLSFVFPIFFDIAEARWLVPGETNADIAIKEGNRAVCYNGRTKTKYTTIEKALEVAKDDTANNDTIYVIPGTNPVITRDCVIASGDTLCLPYEDNGNDVHTFLNRNDKTSNATFGDSNSENVKINRKNQVTIKENVSLTNNGTLTVGGSIGYGGSAVGITGQTASSYCEILMNSNSNIINKGKINLYGYIKESSKNNDSYIEHKESSFIKLPFVVYDFRGGSYSYACSKENVMPFSNYDFPNCQSLQKFYYGSKMYGLATIYAGQKWSTPDVLVLGTNNDSCLFKLSNNYVTIKYTPSNELYTTNDVITSTTKDTANLTEIRTYGDISLSNLEIDIKIAELLGKDINISIDTSKLYCPLCFKYQVVVEKETFTISNKMKFLGGASLLIKDGATVICDANVSFYQDYIPNITTGGSNLYPSSFKTANLVNNGILNLNSAFGGLVATSETSGILNTNNGFSNSVTTMEILSSTGSSVLAKKDKSEEKAQNALAYVGTTNKPNEPITLTKSKSFKAKGDYWCVVLTDITSVTISPSTGTSDSGEEGTFTLTALIDPAENSSSNVTYYWSCDDGATLSSSSGKTVTLTTPANDSSKDKTYKVSCTVNFTKSDGTMSCVTAEGSFTATASCFAKGTKIMLGDGTTKAIEEIAFGDKIMTWNFFKGCYEEQDVALVVDHGESAYELTTLEFSDGTSLSIIGEHGIFDYGLNEFIYLNSNNYSDYIGHEFVKNNNDTNSLVKLINGSIKTEITHAYSITSAYNYNSIANGLLTAPPPGEFYNWIEMSEKMMYDSERFLQDVKTYGLYEYSMFEPYGVSYEIFEAFNGKYLRIPVEKGIFTFEYIIDLFNTYKEWFY